MQWVYRPGGVLPLLAVAASNAPEVHLFNADETSDKALHIVKRHPAPVLSIGFHPASNVVLSVDARGFIEYWDPTRVDANFAPAPAAGITWQLKSDTDLFALAKAKAMPLCVAASPDGKRFAVMATDRSIRVFNFRTGKQVRLYSEDTAVYEDAFAAGACACRVLAVCHVPCAMRTTHAWLSSHQRAASSHW